MHTFRHLVVSGGLLAGILAAQPPAPPAKPPEDAARLIRLLAELRGLPPDAWQRRIAELRAEIAGHAKRAASLRQQAEEMRKEAAQEDGRAAALLAEIKRLESLMGLVRDGAEPAAPAKAAAPIPPAKPAPASEPPKKPAMPAARPAAKKPAPAKPADAVAAQADLVDWQTHVLPILEENCLACHAADEASGGLDVSTLASALRGGGSGKTIVPGQPEQSRLYLLVAHREKPFMPKDADKLRDAQIERIRRWIADGCPEDAAAAQRAAVERARKAKDEAAPRQGMPRDEGPVPMPTALAPLAPASVVQPPPIRALAVSPRAPLVAVAGHGQVLLYHADRLELLGVLAFPLGQVEVVRFRADGRGLLVAGGQPGKRGGAVLYEVTSGKVAATFGRETDTVLAAAVDPAGTVVALAGPSKKVRAYAVASGELLYEIEGHRDWVLSLDISRDGRLLASADRAGTVLVSETENGRNVCELRGHADAVPVVCLRADGKVAATGGADGTVRLFETENGTQTSSQRAHGGGVTALAFASDGSLVSSGEDGRLVLWRANGASGGELPKVGEWVYGLGFAADAGRVFAGDWHGRLHVLDVKTRKAVRELVPALAKVQS